MRLPALSVIIAAAVLLAGPVSAQEGPEVRSLGDGASSPPAEIEDLAWLVGHWIGEGLGGKSEEVVAPPLDGQMMAMFRQTKPDGSLRFYEFYLIVEKDGSLELQIKHFHPDFVGWEEKDKYVAFPLVAVEENAVYFDGVTFDSPAPDELRSAVIVGGQGKMSFHYRCVTPPLE